MWCLSRNGVQAKKVDRTSFRDVSTPDPNVVQDGVEVGVGVGDSGGVVLRETSPHCPQSPPQGWFQQHHDDRNMVSKA
jgi:hypothetical protein